MGEMVHGVPGSCKQVLSDVCAADIGVDSNVVVARVT